MISFPSQGSIAFRDITDPFVTVEVHSFCDASKCVHGACLYLLFTTKSGSVKVTLVTSKSNVNPIIKSKNPKKPISMPRLELRGAVVSSCMTEVVMKELESSYSFDGVVMWTDSSCVYSWILNSNVLYEKFVQDRL